MSTKKAIVATIVGASLVAAMAPALVGAVTIEELLAQIAQLQAQLAALQAQQSGSSGVPAACVGVTFTRNLTVGSTGADVKCLQALLNQKGYTVATTGAGSPGNETTYFGPKTLAAVRAYQAAQGWTPANQVGPLTRASLNNLLSSTASTGTTTGTTTTGITTVGATGYLSIPNLAATPATNTSVKETNNVPVLGVNLKAIGSDMKVLSAKVQLKVLDSDSSEVHPATLLRTLYAYDGSTLLGTYPISSSNVIKNGSDYYVILSGLNFIVPVNTTKTLTLKADVVSGLETDRTLYVALYESDAVRAIDGAGAVTTAGLDSSDFTTSGRYRYFTFDYDVVGSSTLSIISSVNTPKTTAIVVDGDSGYENAPMLIFGLKSTIGQSKVTDVVVKVTADTNITSKITAVKLYDGSTLLGSLTPSFSTYTAYVTFEDLEVYVAKDTTKYLTVKIDFNPLTSVTGAKAVQVSAYSARYEKPDLSSTTVYASSIDGETMYVINDEAAIYTLSSANVSYSYNSQTPSASSATATFVMRVKAEGATVEKPLSANITVKVYNSAGTEASGTVSKAVSVSPDSDIPEGSEATVTLTATINKEENSSGLYYFKITQIDWKAGSNNVSQTWGLDDFKTAYFNMQ